MNKKIFWITALPILILLSFQNCSRVNFGTIEQESTFKSEGEPEEPGVLPDELPLCREVDAIELQPKIKWDWYSQLDKNLPENHPDFSQVMASPMVADLNGDGTPEVVFIGFTVNSSLWYPDSMGPSYSRNGVLRIVNGSTGATLKSIGTQELAPYGTASPLLVDLDADGKIEIIYPHYLGAKLIALNSDGSLRWEYTASKSVFTIAGFAAADFDQDGRAEIVLANEVIHEGSSGVPESFFALEGNPSGVYQFASGLDYSKPDEIQVMGQNGVFNSQGDFLFPLNSNLRYATGDLYPFIPGKEIVGSGVGLLEVFNGLTGAPLTSIDLKPLNELLCPSGKVGGGPPTLGDFDGNPDTIEIAVATGKFLTLFTAEGDIMAKYETQDCSSLVTGISSFDFNGDGKPEILYVDEEYLRIFEVHKDQLRVVYKTVNPSGTLLEYPVVVDVDGNGSSEIVVVSNNYAIAGFYTDAGEETDKVTAAGVTGVRAFESLVKNSWMPTRKIWNQFDYNPQMVSETGKADARLLSQDNYTNRTFRRNSQLGIVEPKCQ